MKASAKAPAQLKLASWIMLVLLATGVGLASLRYAAGGLEVAPPELRSNMAAQRFFFLVHVFGGAAALLLVPWQFAATLRARRPRVHRVLGAAYVAAVAAGGLAAYPVAAGSSAGGIAAAGFSLLAACWLGSTAAGIAMMLRRRIARHRDWMVRSAALTCAAITLRLYLPVPPLLGIDYMEGYRAIAWLCWIPNLLAAEAWIRMRRGRIVSATGEPRFPRSSMAA